MTRYGGRHGVSTGAEGKPAIEADGGLQLSGQERHLGHRDLGKASISVLVAVAGLLEAE